MDTPKSITKIRKEKGYSQRQIAKLLETTQQQYSKYEQGHQEIPVRHIITLCEFYGVTANKLIGVETYMSENEIENKFNQLYNEVIDIIEWAKHQEHINDEAADILLSNIENTKEKLINSQG